MSGTNICNLPKLDLGRRSNISDLEEEPESMSFTPNPVTKSKSETNINEIPKKKYSTYSDPGDTLTSTFREYLSTRSMLATPVDLSFSSRTDDYDSTDEIPSEDKLSESLLFCLDGNRPPSLDSSLDNSVRKRSADDCDGIEPKKFIVEKELVLKPKQFGANGEPIIYETSF